MPIQKNLFNRHNFNQTVPAMAVSTPAGLQGLALIDRELVLL